MLLFERTKNHNAFLWLVILYGITIHNGIRLKEYPNGILMEYAKRICILCNLQVLHFRNKSLEAKNMVKTLNTLRWMTSSVIGNLTGLVNWKIFQLNYVYYRSFDWIFNRNDKKFKQRSTGDRSLPRSLFPLFPSLAVSSFIYLSISCRSLRFTILPILSIL